MPSNYHFRLNANDIKITVVDEFGPLNTWSGTPHDPFVVGAAGGVTSRDEPKAFILHTGGLNPDPVVTLHGASWDSRAGDVGRAEPSAFLNSGATEWELVRVE